MKERNWPISVEIQGSNPENLQFESFSEFYQSVWFGVFYSIFSFGKSFCRLGRSKIFLERGNIFEIVSTLLIIILRIDHWLNDCEIFADKTTALN